MTSNDDSLTRQQPVTVDPNFFLPPGLINAEYTSEAGPPSDDEETVSAIIVPEIEELVDQTVTSGGALGLRPPDFVTLYSQTVRIAADGRQVVDVVLDVEAVDGAADYEVRYSRT